MSQLLLRRTDCNTSWQRCFFYNVQMSHCGQPSSIWASHTLFRLADQAMTNSFSCQKTHNDGWPGYDKNTVNWDDE